MTGDGRGIRVETDDVSADTQDPALGEALMAASTAADSCSCGPLAQDMGASLDETGEAVLLTLQEISARPALQHLALRLFNDFRSRRAAIRESLRNEGLSEADLWAPGVSESVSAESSDEDIRRYRLKLQYRADFLKAALEETLQELDAVAAINRPTGPLDRQQAADGTIGRCAGNE